MKGKLKSLAEPARKPEPDMAIRSKPEKHYPRIELSADQLGTVLEGKRVGQKHTLVFQGTVDGVRTADGYSNHPKGTELVTFNLTHGCVLCDTKKGKTPKSADQAANESVEEGKDFEARARITKKMKAYG